MKKFFKVSTVIVIAFAITFTTSCMKSQDSKFKNEVITANNISELVQKIKDENTMGKEDIEILTAGIARLSQVKDSIIGKKIAQVLDIQKEYLRKNSMLGLVNTGTQVEMNLALTVKFTKRLKYENDTLNADGIEFQLINNSDKEITSITGAIRMANDKNEILGVRPIKYVNLSLKPGTTYTQPEVWPYVDDATHKAFRNEVNLIPVWIPETIEFAGGKKITINQDAK
jgi:hypothetical protein